MKSSTKRAARKDGVEMVREAEAWERAAQQLGWDLEASARRHKALVRRREIQSASALLRMVLVYCMEDWSLLQTGLWAVLQGIGYLSDVAVLKRLRNCRAWLGELLFTGLQQRRVDLAQRGGLRVRLRDASVINGPGSTGTQWRLHMKLDVAQHCISGVEVTDAHGGETLARLPIEAGEILVADRGHAFASGIGAVLDQQAHLVVRINWQNLSLRVAKEGTRFALVDWLHCLTAPQEHPVWLETPQGWVALRLIACPLAPQQAEAARRRARQAARKKKHTIRPATLLAAGFLLLLTDLPQQQWPIPWVAWLYRLRWQVELQFKTYKSLLHFDHLRARTPHLAQTYLLGKLLLVLLLEQLTQQVHLRQPDWFTHPNRPLAHWSLTTALKTQLSQLLVGPLCLARFWACLPALERYVRLSPRARPNQLAWAQATLERLSCYFSFFSC